MSNFKRGHHQLWKVKVIYFLSSDFHLVSDSLHPSHSLSITTSVCQQSSGLAEEQIRCQLLSTSVTDSHISYILRNNNNNSKLHLYLHDIVWGRGPYLYICTIMCEVIPLTGISIKCHFYQTSGQFTSPQLIDTFIYILFFK